MVFFAFFGVSFNANNIAIASTEVRSIDEIRELLNTDGIQYKRIYSETGNVETFEEPLTPEFIDYFSSELYSASYSQTQSTMREITNPFTVTTIVDSGLADSQSIVVVTI